MKEVLLVSNEKEERHSSKDTMISYITKETQKQRKSKVCFSFLCFVKGNPPMSTKPIPFLAIEEISVLRIQQNE